MPERSSVRAHALHDADARLRAVQARLDALGAMFDARIGVLEARWAALSGAACFDPFALPATDDAVVNQGPGEAQALRRRGAVASPLVPSAAARKPSSLPAPAAFGPRLGAAVTRAMENLGAASKRGSARQNAAPRSMPKPAAPQGAAHAPPPPSGAFGGVRRFMPTTPGSHGAETGAAAAVAAALADVASSLRSPLPGPQRTSPSPADTALADAQAAPSPTPTAALAAPVLLQYQLDRLSVAPTHAASRGVALPAADAPGPPTVPGGLVPMAARAPSRLLAPASPGTLDTPRTAEPLDDPSVPAAEAFDALAELNRRLIDQAWLRGVDLS